MTHKGELNGNEENVDGYGLWRCGSAVEFPRPRSIIVSMLTDLDGLMAEREIDWLVRTEWAETDRRLLVPDDGSAGAVLPQWSGTPMIRAVADDAAWPVLLETGDPYLDRYPLPMATDLTEGELRDWRRAVQAAWELLVRHHRWTADPVASGVSVIVPLMP